MVEEKLPHLPELALCPGGLGRLGGEPRVRVDVLERQVAPDVPEVAGLGEQFADDRLRPPAVRALEVAVLEKRHRSVVGAAHVVVLGIDGHREVYDRLRPEQSARPERRRQSSDRYEDEPAEERGADGSAEDAELRLLELLPVERERRDQERDGEADAGDRAGAEGRAPTDR